MVVQPYEVGNCLTARMHKGINSTLDEGQTPVISIHPHCIGRAPEAGPQGKEYLLDGSAYCMDGRGQPQAVAQPIPIDMRNAGRDPEKHDEMNRQGVGVGEPGDPAHTVTSAFVHGVAQPMVLMDQGGSVMNVEHDMVGTLRRETHGHEPAVLTAMQVRRLTPVECERLQGFPDGYTNIPWRKKPESPDGPRYKALGNSWAVPNVHWIGKRIQEALNAPA